MRPSIKSKKCFLFDLDGTLVDSNEFHGLAFREVLARSAPEILPNFDYETVKGRSTREVFAGFGFANETQISVLTAEKQSAYSSAISKSGLPLISGARELLDFLSLRNKRLFVVSAGGRTSVEQALRAARIRDYFEGVTTSDDVQRSKPSPDIYNKCLETHDLMAGDCVAIEDSDSGIAASMAAGIDSVLIAAKMSPAKSYAAFPSLESFYRHVVDALGGGRDA